MSDDRATQDLDVPVYGTLTVYPKGSRQEADQQQFNTPGSARVGPDDGFGFTFGAVADVTDGDVQRFADAVGERRTTLRYLVLSGCQQVTDRGLGYLALFERLEELGLSALDRATPRGLAVLGRLGRLRVLTLESARRVDDTTAKSLAGLRHLVDLNLNLCPNLTDAGAEELSRMEGLEALGVNEARLTDRGVAALARLRRLKSISLPAGRFTDRALELLAELPDLAYVTLPNCSGFLRRLLAGHGISRAGLARFREAKPDCDVWSPEIYEETQRQIAAAMKLAR